MRKCVVYWFAVVLLACVPAARATIFGSVRGIAVSYTHLDVYKRQLEYAERLIAVQPDNSDMMMLAVTMLQQRGDDASLTRAAGYVTRVLDRIEKASPADKPPQQSIAEWRGHQDRMRTGLYALRANVEKAQRNYDAAVKDLKQSYSLHPNGVAAIMLLSLIHI